MQEKDLIIIREGNSKFYIYKADINKIPSKSMSVFYNKRMEINRDITSLAINTYRKLYNQENLIIVDSMAASGIGSIRILEECQKVEKIIINDINPLAISLIKKNISLNTLEKSLNQIVISNLDSTLLLSQLSLNKYEISDHITHKPNVISIDPFGTPNIYLDSAFKAIRNFNGLMCITATDTAVLFGVKPKACIRKYFSRPLHNEYCKEIGARILLYFISRIANINDIGIIPLLTFYSNHFIRIFCLTFKNKKKISKSFESYGYIIHCNNCGYRTALQNNIFLIPKRCPLCNKNDNLDYAGPLWVDAIHNPDFLEEILITNENFNFHNKNRIKKLISLALEEVDMPVSYYNVHKMCRDLKIPYVPKITTLIRLIRDSGSRISRTHFDFLSIKTDMDLGELRELLLKLK